ncbi:unnamed protein product, partial [Didymodactylos carnosus]
EESYNLHVETSGYEGENDFKLTSTQCRNRQAHLAALALSQESIGQVRLSILCAAAEWYQQLVQSDGLPATWREFIKLFQARFQSSERIEALKIERNRCIQQSDESVADFYQRYKGLALEIDPKISEKPLKRHLLPKLRPDILQLMGGVDADKLTLPDLMRTAAKVELHMLQRKKGAQQRTDELAEFSKAMKSSKNRNNKKSIHIQQKDVQLILNP